ncbi:MAG: DUF11 domain-containing protein [Actinomycetota bacterium]|nr:DUF11 domain-containing protein [Actinomycetota bacterium]
MRALIGGLAVALGLMASLASTAYAEEPTFTVRFTCTGVTYTFTGFPNLPNNTVHEVVAIDAVKVAFVTFKFNGPTGSNTVKVAVPPGHHQMDARAKWETNGVKGGRDQPLKGGITCESSPASTVTKAVRDEGQTDTDTGNYGPSASAVPSDFIDYQLTYTNSGTGPANNVTLTDVMQAHQTFISCSSAVSACTPASSANGNTVSWSLGTVAPGVTIIVDFEVKLDAVFPAGTTTIDNVANGCIGTSCTQSNHTTVTVTAAPILMLQKSADKPSTAPGHQITYTLTYSNTGNADATGVVINEAIPAGTQFVSCSGACSPGTSSDTTESWSIGTVKAGAPAASVTLTVRVLDTAGCSIVNTATISSPDEPGSVQTPIKSNTLTISSQPGPRPDLANANGEGFGVQITGLVPLAPTPDAKSSQHGVGVNASSPPPALPVNVPGVLSANVLNAGSTSTVSQQPAQADNTSVGETATVNVLAGAITADVVQAKAEAIASGTGSSVTPAGTTETNLRIEGTSVADVAPNTRVDLLAGGVGSYVVINEETSSTSLTSGTYFADLTVTALHVHIAGTLQISPQDIYISRARAHADFPQIVVCNAQPNQDVSGHAFVASETTNPLLAPLTAGLVSIPPQGGSASQNLASVSLPGDGSVVQANAASSRTQGTITRPTSSTAGSSTSTSSASAGDGTTPTGVSVLKGLITAQLLKAQANSSAGPTGASSNATGTQILSLVIAGTPIANNPAPNTAMQLPGSGEVIINEQISEDDLVNGHTGLTVRAIDVIVDVSGNPLNLPLGARVIVSEAHSDATYH